MDNLPEFYIADDGARIGTPTYEALKPIFINMTSPETGQTGPTMLNAGEHFTTEGIPCHWWKPLNRAAGETVERWLASLPMDGKNIPQELITQAAYEMRPREGDPDFPIEQWWPMVMKRASTLAEQRRGGIGLHRPAAGHRPGMTGAPQQVMPFTQSGPAMPFEPGRAPPPTAAQSLQASQMPGAARRSRPRPPTPLAGSQAGDTPQSTTG